MCPIPRAGPVLPSRPRNVHREHFAEVFKKEQLKEKLWSRGINFSPLPGSCFWNTLPKIRCSAHLGALRAQRGTAMSPLFSARPFQPRSWPGFGIHGRTAVPGQRSLATPETPTLAASKLFLLLMPLMKARVFPDLEAVLSPLAARRR